MAIQSIAHVCLYTADLEATRKFYCDVLGLEKQFNFTRAGRLIGFYLRAGNRTFVEVFENGQGPMPQAGNISHFCLETDAIEPLREKMEALGYKPEPLHHGADKSYQFWVTDPNGVRFEFHQYTPASAQFRHEDVEANW